MPADVETGETSRNSFRLVVHSIHEVKNHKKPKININIVTPVKVKNQ